MMDVINSTSVWPIFAGLLLLGVLLHDAIRPKPVIKLRRHWVCPDQVQRISGPPPAIAQPAGAGASDQHDNTISIHFLDGKQINLRPNPGESAEDLREKLGQAIQKRRNLAD